MSMSSLYGQHMGDGLNFSCVAFMDALFFFLCFVLLCFVFFLADHVPGFPLLI